MNKKIKIKAFEEINDNCIGVCTIAYHDRHSKPTTTALILPILVRFDSARRARDDGDNKLLMGGRGGGQLVVGSSGTVGGMG